VKSACGPLLSLSKPLNTHSRGVAKPWILTTLACICGSGLARIYIKCNELSILHAIRAAHMRGGLQPIQVSALAARYPSSHIWRTLTFKWNRHISRIQVVVSWSNKSMTLSTSHYEGNRLIRVTTQLMIIWFCVSTRGLVYNLRELHFLLQNIVYNLGQDFNIVHYM
jgi:hypothetical protein